MQICKSSFCLFCRNALLFQGVGSPEASASSGVHRSASSLLYRCKQKSQHGQLYQKMCKVKWGRHSKCDVVPYFLCPDCFQKPWSPTQQSWCSQRPPWKKEWSAESRCTSGAPGRTQASQYWNVHISLSACNLLCHFKKHTVDHIFFTVFKWLRKTFLSIYWQHLEYPVRENIE